MRLDVFLKLSRLIPRRPLAQKFCENGMVSVNGSIAKPSKEVRVGDEIEIRRGTATTTVVVLDVPGRKQLSKAEAETIFELISSERRQEPDLLP